MKRWIRGLLMIILPVASGNPVFSQENYASNILKSADDEKLVITYDIDSRDDIRSFTVVLFIASEGKQVKPSSAYGDVGVNIKPGTGKAIVWYYKSDFDGSIENVTIDVFAYKENEPQAVFKITSLSNNGYAPCEVKFSNQSAYANEYEWNFGDPASGAANLSFEKDPVHVYQKGGVYSISLTARNTQLRLENVYYQSIEIKKHDSVIADFQIEGNHQLSPAKVKFDNTSVNADDYEWNFGDPSRGRRNESTREDGKFKYKNPGIYRVQLVAKNDFSGLTDTLIKEVVVEQEKTAEAGFIYSKSSDTAPSVVTFKNTSTNADSYGWNFNDPSSGDKNESSEANPTHLFSDPGNYEVQLSARARGMKKPATYSEVITIEALPQPPEARFSIQNNHVIGPATILFSNQSKNATRFLWDFGDPESGEGNRSTKKSPTHTYQKPGSYEVVLTATSPGFTRESKASDRVVITGPIKSEVSPKVAETEVIIETEHPAAEEEIVEEPVTVEKTLKPPVAEFEVIMRNENAPATVDFNNLSVRADSFKWRFGDADSEQNESTDQNPGHTYQVPGTYHVILEARNSESGEAHQISKEITVSSDFSTFVASAGLGLDAGQVLSLVSFTDDQFLALMKSREGGSTLVKIDEHGDVTDRQAIDTDLFALIPVEDGSRFMMAGVEGAEKLFLQEISAALKAGESMYFPETKSFQTGFAYPRLALSSAQEIGVVANTINDRYPLDVFFQKVDASGRIIPLADRTFKYVGNKMVTDIVSTIDGGFAITGYWQKNSNSLRRILFARIDRAGAGKIQLISSDLDILGCDIENSFQGGFAILRAEVLRENSNMYEISFTLVDSQGAPTDCANILPCSIKEEDMVRYRPTMIKNEDGYVVASHGFNGVDYDITLFWIDRTGEELIRYETIRFPGDQFVMDFKKDSNGGYIVAGTQKTDENISPLIIRTDPWGKLNP